VLCFSFELRKLTRMWKLCGWVSNKVHSGLHDLASDDVVVLAAAWSYIVVCDRAKNIVVRSRDNSTLVVSAHQAEEVVRRACAIESGATTALVLLYARTGRVDVVRWEASSATKATTVTSTLMRTGGVDADVSQDDIAVVDTAGTLWLFDIQTLVPRQQIASLSTADPFVRVVCGARHFALITGPKGRVYTFGSGAYGQLGLGEVRSTVDLPLLVTALDHTRVVDVAAGAWHTLFLTEEGDVYAAGWNQHGQLGVDSASTTNLALPNVIDFEGAGDGDNSEDVSIVKIACGSAHSVALSSKGRLYSWGWGKYGQLGTKADSICAPRPVDTEDTTVNEILCGRWSTFVSL